MGLATAQPAYRTSQRTAQLRILAVRFRWNLIVPALYVAVTVLLLWPLVIHIRSAVADTLGDPLLNAWTLRWVQHALVTQPTHLYDGNMFAPNARSLAFSELLLPQAIMAWPLWLVSHDALLAYNASLLLTYPLCGVAMYALCRGLGAIRGAAFIAGLAFAFAPFRMDNNAHLQVLSMQWMPLTILAIIRFMQRPTRWRFAAVVATTILASLSSVYYTVMFGTALIVFFLVEAIRQRRLFISRTGIGLLAALAIAAVVVAAIDLPYLTMRREQNIVRTLDEAYDDAAHKTSYVTVTPGNYLWGGLLPTSGVERSALFPGAILLAFGIAGLRTVRRPWMAGLATLGVVSVVLSFGPTWGDKTTGTPLPYRFLYQHIVGYQGIRGPDRFAAVVLLALCPFAALGATWLWRAVVWRMPRLLRLAPVVACVFSLLTIADCAARLLPTIPVDRSANTLAPYQWLASQTSTGTVAEFPVETSDTQTAFYSTYHWHNVLWGHSGFIPAATYQLRGHFVGHNDSPAPEDLDALADMGVGTLVIHRSGYTADQFATITQILKSASRNVTFLATVGDSDIYRLLPDRSAPPLTVRVTFMANPAGNLDKLPGKLILTNPGMNERMLYTRGYLAFTAEILGVGGKQVSSQPVPISLPAVIPNGGITLPFTVQLPSQPGMYTVRLRATNVPLFDIQPSSTVTVISPTTLPNLTLSDREITSPSLYKPGENVAMWVTLKDGKSIALRDTVALPDGTLRVTLDPLPPGAVQVVAHGKSSGVELWVATP
ncbi:MAG: hypothetical protein M3Z19_12060 [Chloroflexota bacterium]|nr:hypothetical protein [Chloroflexota bacterium]